jgi:hypothetical protein
MKDKIFNKFISRLGLYNGLIYQNKKHLADIILTYKKTSKQISPDLSIPMFGSKLVYRNVLTRKHEIAYSHFVDNKNIEESIAELNLLFCNMCISQCYEAFETYLKDIVALKLLDTPSLVTSLDKEIITTNFKACRDSIDKAKWKTRKNNKHLFSLLYKLNPEIRNIESDNVISFNFSEWYVVFSDIRHSIVHANSYINIQPTKEYSKFQKDILNKLFLTSKGSELHNISSVDDYQYLIEIVAQHGQLINDSLQKGSR